jgi:hypothetical protein
MLWHFLFIDPSIFSNMIPKHLSGFGRNYIIFLNVKIFKIYIFQRLNFCEKNENFLEHSNIYIYIYIFQIFKFQINNHLVNMC